MTDGKMVEKETEPTQVTAEPTQIKTEPTRDETGALTFDHKSFMFICSLIHPILFTLATLIQLYQSCISLFVVIVLKQPARNANQIESLGACWGIIYLSWESTFRKT